MKWSKIVMENEEKLKIKKSHYNSNDEWIKQNHTYIGYIENEVVVTAFLNEYEDYLLIDRLDTEEEYQNKGYGTQILKEIQKDFNTVYIVPDNKDAARLYERIGRSVVDKPIYDKELYALDNGFGVFEL